tara:strand:+ start:382 stop:603 length:222 start_codon:yes stop_codon:yes gene_type:complete
MEKIKQWISKTGGTYVIVEGEEPKFVVLDIASYERLIGGLTNRVNEEKQVNQQIATISNNKEAQVQDIINGLR